MKINFLTKQSAVAIAAVAATSVSCNPGKIPKELPNILWIVSEDNSAFFVSCYGNSFATTPNIDNLASQGFLYTSAFCNTPVSAPHRNTMLTGVYAASNGNEPMRSTYPKSDVVRTYPEYLREAGYYCTNNSKTDYNTSSVIPDEIWDESSNKAHFRNRPEGRPFFAVFNLNSSHESSIQRKQSPEKKLRHDPAKVTLPPYHPDTPEMRCDWALYYDNVEDMDMQVGELLKELDESGFAENTIVMYYGDNGGVLPRSKRFVYESGTKIPFIVRIPEKYRYLYPSKKPGDKVSRLISGVDLAPTLCSIIGTLIPEYMQGSAFLGRQKTKDPEYVFLTRQRMDERYDLIRAVRDKEYRYIKNYMPFRATMQYLRTLFSTPSTKSWADAYNAGQTNEVQSKFFHEKPVEELYDVEKDPWEVNNLAADPAYKDILERMRLAEADYRRQIRDVGLIPEDEYGFYSGEKSMYDYMRSAECPFEELMKAADMAVMGGPESLDVYTGYLKNEHSGIRYWGVTGLMILKDKAKPAIPALMEAAGDRAGSVASLAAEALYILGEKEAARKAFVNILTNRDIYDFMDRNFALNCIDIINDESTEVKSAVQKLVTDMTDNPGPQTSTSGYEMRSAPYLLQKWGINVAN